MSKSWRDVLPIHPAAELFPRMAPDELKVLGEDIVKSGLTSHIALWRADPKSPVQLLDGRNRLDAIELVTGKPVEIGAPSIMAGEFLATGRVIELDGRKVDPWPYVISANIHRRHLNVEQRQNLLIALIARAPEKSDRQLGKEIGVDHKTIANARAKGEATGEISPVKKRIGKDGKARKQPTQKAPTEKQPAEKQPTKQPEKQPARNEPVESATTITSTRGDIGADSTGEIERLRARNAELENHKRQLEIKVEGFKNEIKELKTENAALREKLEAARGTAVASSTNTVTAGDPGPFSECLRRKPKATDAPGNSNGEVTLKDAVPDAFRKLKDLAGECNDVVDKAPEHLDQAPRIETLRETAIVLEDLRVPDVPAELASINIALLKPRRLRSRGDRRDAALDMIDACMKALNTIPQGDPRHQQACDLCAKLQDASTDAENCEFPGMYG